MGLPEFTSLSFRNPSERLPHQALTAMYPSSTSSSSQGSIGATTADGGGLMRNGSAPSSLIATAVDSVIGAGHGDAGRPDKPNPMIGLQRAYAFAAPASRALLRHSSSPPGFLNQLAAAADSVGFSITRGVEDYSNPTSIARLNSQLSFTRQENTLSHISEESESIVGDEIGSQHGQTKSGHYGYSMGTSWDESNAVMFTMAPSKRAKISNAELMSGLDNMENQFQFGLAQGGLDMAGMDKLINMPHDSVPCKIRAKRGCATHPRSIAERERRTRISGKLKKLQVLVPNMDKQTSYADMLDLAVQHIKCLQNEVQKLNQELETCTCGSGCKARGQ